MQEFNMTHKTLDMKKIMVIVKGEDKTAEIEKMKYVSEPGKIGIKYFRGKTTYNTSRKYIEILENPELIEIGTSVMYIGDMPVNNPQLILRFGKNIRICEKGRYFTVAIEQIKLVDSAVEEQKGGQIINYLKDIAQYTKTEENSEYKVPFLKNQLDNMTFVHPESVLADYLMQQPVKQRSLEGKGIIFPFQFNLSQKKALENALTHSISVIQGPPGTGKTQTILNILANLIALQHKSVAVVSNNGEAVKNVIEKMSKEGYGFLGALLGKKENRERFFQDIPIPQIPEGWKGAYTSEWMLERIKEIDRKLTVLQYKEREKKQRQQELREWCLEQEHFEEYYLKRDIESSVKLPLFCKTPNKIMSFLAETALSKEYTQYRKGIYKLKLFFKYGVFDIRKLEFQEIEIVLMLQKKYYQLQISKLKNRIKTLDRQLERESFSHLLEEYQEFSEAVFKRSLYESHKKYKMPNFTLKSYKSRFEEFKREFPIILSTTHSLRSSIPQNYLLDYVIIDEASQVDLITAVLALSCCRNVIIVGDMKQLPQIVNINIKQQICTEVTNEAYDYFKENILSSILKLYKNTVPCTTLREHYRCHPQIIEFCNKQYYDGELIAYTKEDMSEAPLLLYKTAQGNHMRELTYDKKKKVYNQRELDVIVNEVLENKELENKENVGFVTPFRKQVSKAESLLDEEIQCDTVHKYQGREKDIMIMSTVLDETYAGIKRLEFVDDSQMVNVAVSRAVKQFILVTNHDLFSIRGKNLSALLRYIQYSTLDENVVESQVVSVFDLLYKKYSSKLSRYKKKMNTNARWRSEEVLRVLLEDILSQSEYSMYTYAQGVLLKNLINDDSQLSEAEKTYINNRASVDFVIYYKMDKSPVLVVEVDGFAFHENNPQQLQKDKMKDLILEQKGIEHIRLATNGSGEKEKIMNKLSGNKKY